MSPSPSEDMFSIGESAGAAKYFQSTSTQFKADFLITLQQFFFLFLICDVKTTHVLSHTVRYQMEYTTI